MNGQKTGLTAVFGVLLIVTLGGILYHYLSGYHYPASAAFAYELNVLGDVYEAFFVVPLGIMGLWTLWKGNVWGPILIAGAAANLTYNYAMIVAGRQNLWIFLWIVKLALAGTAVCLVWNFLPSGRSRPLGQRLAAAAYLLLVLVAFSGMMGQRLLASASGRSVDMTMQEAGAIDWGEPFLRDPIIFFSFVCPMVISAILGLLQGRDWGGKAAALSNAFIVMIVSIVLFTGPLKEYLQIGSVSRAMLGMSVIMILAAAPAVWSLIWLAKGESRFHP